MPTAAPRVLAAHAGTHPGRPLSITELLARVRELPSGAAT